MPELPEVETTRAGLAPHLIGRCVRAVRLHRADLRFPIAPELASVLPGLMIADVRRRAKYLLLDTAQGSVLLHLGMSGSLRVLNPAAPLKRHDHIEIDLDSGLSLRLHDPRRFGCCLWQAPQSVHPLLQKLGPEPFDLSFNADYLYRLSRGRSAAVKTFLMDQQSVVGVGNIYAAEALFAAGIDPRRAAGAVSRARYAKLCAAVRMILGDAISQGGTTLRDFLNPSGSPGYFAQRLSVYGREGKSCVTPGCRSTIAQVTLGQRASFFCPSCQR